MKLNHSRKKELAKIELFTYGIHWEKYPPKIKELIIDAYGEDFDLSDINTMPHKLSYISDYFYQSFGSDDKFPLPHHLFLLNNPQKIISILAQVKRHRLLLDPQP